MSVAIGIYAPRKRSEVEFLRRTIVPFGVDYTFQIGGYEVTGLAGTPHIFYRNLDRFLLEGRSGLDVVALELTPAAVPLSTFDHPKSVAYLLGPSTGTLPKAVLAAVSRKVYVETPNRRVLDTSAVAAVVLHDRHVTLTREAAA